MIELTKEEQEAFIAANQAIEDAKKEEGAAKTAYSWQLASRERAEVAFDNLRLRTIISHIREVTADISRVTVAQDQETGAIYLDQPAPLAKVVAMRQEEPDGSQ